jgi:nucleotide-binding universal stress UspA family protein
VQRRSSPDAAACHAISIGTEEGRMKLDRVVIATDFTDSSGAAARWAALHLVAGAELVLVHGVDVPEPTAVRRARAPARRVLIDTARTGADAWLRALSPSLGAARVWLEVRVGSAAEEIAAIARRYEADLIVTGRHHERHGVLAHLGSTAEALVRSGVAPVLLGTGVRDVRPRRILAARDGGDATDAVVSCARLLAERSGAGVTALHVVPSAVLGAALAPAVPGADAADDDGRDPSRRDADRYADALVAGGLPRDRVSSETAFGEPGQEILAAAERHESELVVMGTHNRGGVRRLLLGSVAREVLRGAACPVVVVPPSADDIVG